MSKKAIIVLFLALTVGVGAVLTASGMSGSSTFSRCMNIGNALDAPKDIPWDVEMKKVYFDQIKIAGFDCVRLPVRFSDYAKDQPGYVLEESFMKEIDGYIDYALRLGLVVILDMHHFVEMMNSPDQYRDVYLAVWKQLAARYQSYPEQLVFELLNEPSGQLKGELWNRYLMEAVIVIRKTNKNRTVIVGPDQYNSLDGLDHLVLPKDKHLMVTFHFYEPNTFTFQGNPYHAGFEHLNNISWTGTPEEKQKLRVRFTAVKEWADRHGVRVFLGEFGANQNAPAESRILWTKAVRELAEEMGFSWSYWELCSAFGIMDAKTLAWDKNMLDALIQPK